MDDRRRAVSLVFGLLLLVWATVEVLAGNTGLLYAAPTLLLALPLTHGLYPAEGRLRVLVERRRARRRRPLRILPARSRPRQMDRGGQLIACAMAKRPPPGTAPRLIAA
jgi:hypothetical protein